MLTPPSSPHLTSPSSLISAHASPPRSSPSLPHKSTRPYMLSVTAIPTQPLTVSRLASASHIPTQPFLHSLTPRLCLSKSHASSFSCFAAATLFLRNIVLLFFLSSKFLLLGFSGFLHLVLLFVLFIMWVCNKFKVGHSEGPKERFKNIRCLYHKQAPICCLGVSVFSLVLCLLNYLFFCFFFLGHELGPIP